MWSGKHIETLGGTKIQISEKNYVIIPGCQKALVDSSYDTMKSMPDMDTVVFRDILHTSDYYKRLTKKGRLSGREKFLRDDLYNEVIRISNLDTKKTESQFSKLKGKGEKIIAHPRSSILGLG